MAAFLGSPGRAYKPEAAQRTARRDGAGLPRPRDRIEAAKVLAMIPEPPLELLAALINDPDPDVWRQALLASETIGAEAVDVLADRLADRSLSRRRPARDPARADAHRHRIGGARPHLRADGSLTPPSGTG